ncbi:hypothetical protein CPB85DRAFT_414164 [Mucidula mucida]|nr:hypothetical protein CPB85DRAFT_414164 [Mucidula mucida]
MYETVIPSTLQTLGLGEHKCILELLELEIQGPGNPMRQTARRSKKVLSSMPIIGNLEVLLPCQFTGGQLTVSHPSLPGSLRRVNCDETNSNILVISSGSYAGMRHSFDVVHTGYRVSLVYALKSTTTRSVRGHLDFFFAIDIIRVLSANGRRPGTSQMSFLFNCVISTLLRRISTLVHCETRIIFYSRVLILSLRSWD